MADDDLPISDEPERPAGGAWTEMEKPLSDIVQDHPKGHEAALGEDVDLDHGMDDEPERTWTHPTECPKCQGALTPVPETFTYRCPQGHLWKKEQFITGDLDQPWAQAGM